MLSVFCCYAVGCSIYIYIHCTLKEENSEVYATTLTQKVVPAAWPRSSDGRASF